MHARSGWGWLAVMAASGLVSAQTGVPRPAGTAAATANVPYVDAKAILDTIRPELLPPELQDRTAGDAESAWPEWVSNRDTQIRARLAAGDHDSIINLLLFGVTFTDQPRVRARDILQLASRGPAAAIIQRPIVQRRIDDMVAAVASPGTNDRLQFVREVVEAAGMEPTTAEGRMLLRRYLEEGLQRVLPEYEAYARAAGPDQSVRFGDRGLSSDTSLFPGFSIEQALQALTAGRLLGPGSVRRVGIVGPGLDFTDKREGYDFYPQQTVQPFAVIDSLRRLGLANRDELRTATFDLSPRVNRHLEGARQRARAGGSYDLHFPRDTSSAWSPELVVYRERLGDRIGAPSKPAAPPVELSGVDVRAVRVPPAVVLTVMPHDLNIVLQRLEPLAPGERFDLIIATNLLVYYDVFERSLAFANVEQMLRPGGLFLANNSTPVILPASLESVGYSETIFSNQPNDRDRINWYRKK
jgi:hypothetical protein